MKFLLEIECDNDSFGITQTDVVYEISRLLEQLIHSDKLFYKISSIIDRNGNTVGYAKFIDANKVGA